ncbi:MAG: SIMPL domain-containing protein [Flavobacteriales bacterium]|nr:SIMPL domain-containing protein [Flavobacteriales bacterium]
MKSKLNLIVVVLASILSMSCNSQNQERKFIEVTGSAEIKLQPDEIVLEIILTEYNDKGKKFKLDDLESEFYKILENNKIDTKKLVLENTNNQWYWHWYWQERQDQYLTKTINLKLNKETNFLKLSEDLKVKWVQSIRVTKTSHSDVQRIRKEIKKEAMRAAKEKATYMLESVGEEIGGLLSVEELPENVPQENQNTWYFNQSRSLQDVTSNSYVNTSNVGVDSNAGVQNSNEIKLRFEVKAKFEIK